MFKYNVGDKLEVLRNLDGYGAPLYKGEIITINSRGLSSFNKEPVYGVEEWGDSHAHWLNMENETRFRLATIKNWKEELLR